MSDLRSKPSPPPPGPRREDDDDPRAYETPALRRLRLLVTTLTVILIGGVLVVSTLLVFRLSGAPASPLTTLPGTIGIPEGAGVAAVGRGAAGEILLVLRRADGTVWLHSYDAGTGALNAATELSPEGLTD